MRNFVGNSNLVKTNKPTAPDIVSNAYLKLMVAARRKISARRTFLGCAFSIDSSPEEDLAGSRFATEPSLSSEDTL